MFSPGAEKLRDSFYSDYQIIKSTRRTFALEVSSQQSSNKPIMYVLGVYFMLDKHTIKVTSYRALKNCIQERMRRYTSNLAIDSINGDEPKAVFCWSHDCCLPTILALLTELELEILSKTLKVCLCELEENTFLWQQRESRD
jgi:hypothetical protein